jgi:hypothetical protein
MTNTMTALKKVNPRAAAIFQIADSATAPYLNGGGRSVAKLVKLTATALRSAGYSYLEYVDMCGIRLSSQDRAKETKVDTVMGINYTPDPAIERFLDNAHLEEFGYPRRK